MRFNVKKYIYILESKKVSRSIDKLNNHSSATFDRINFATAD